MKVQEGREPQFSIVTPVYNPPIGVLRDMIDSVLAQTHDDWELILVDDCSPEQAVRDTLREYAAKDARIRVVERAENGHIVAASNDGLSAARGRFVAFLDHDDLLTDDALAENAAVIERHEDVDYLYSDEDLVRGDGRFTDPFPKPDWSPERLRGQNYCNHFSVMRASLVADVGGFREGFDGSQDHDLVLRVTERARRVEHIAKVLYHWRVIEGSAAGDAEAKPYALEAGRRAVQEHLDRMGINGTVEIGGPGRYVVKRHLPSERRVSIVIPTIGSSSSVWGRRAVLVTRAVRSALASTSHQNIEVVVVYDEPTPARVLNELKAIAGPRLVLVPFREKFNYSRKINLGVLASTGDRLVLLNDDVEVRSQDWLEELVAPLEEPDVGMTGAKLFFSSTAIQHAGLAYSRGEYVHPYRFAPQGTPGKANALRINREVSGVTGACVGMRRDVYFEVGGLTEELPESFNDVDLCYKVLRHDYRILYMAHCELFHFESQTREPTPKAGELRFMRRRWGVPVRDPYTPDYPNLPPTQAERRELRRQAARRSAGLAG
ncbi:O-antigen biosynthesis protein [Marmoricola sp. URHA0025 HA25]